MSNFGAVTIPFDKWREACQRQTSVTDVKENLRQESKKLFSRLFSTTEIKLDLPVKLTTKSAHNEALAQLIKELEPCFSEGGTHVTRVWALYCLCGAVEGCNRVSENLMKLLGSFLLSYCGPLEEDDAEDTEEMVRDTAIMCLAVLVRLSVEENTVEAAQQRLTLAQNGVQRRCATPEEDSMEIDHGYGGGREQGIGGGLSLLPRSRRALCFDLVRAAIAGMTTMEVVDVAEPLATFASFAAECLMGESDPRCLMQVLLILGALQTSFLPFFVDKTLFPKMNLFDAVAPYYPVQFTPPPNDKFGITRLGLQQALMAILCYTEYDTKGERDSMLNLASGLILEQLVPTDDDTTAEEKLAAIKDLNTLLSGKFIMLSPESARELSNSLIATHLEASAGVAKGKKGPQKALADACRSLVSKSALELEADDDLWKVFVEETLQNDAPILATSPQSMKGRSTIAYLACLAAGGGSRTLQASLGACLPQLVDALQQKEDEEKVAAAAYGMGAFFSSFEVASGRGTDIVFHPHPLQAFSSKMFDVLDKIFGGSDNEGTRIAAFHAMVSLLMVTPAELLQDGDVDAICKFVKAGCALVGPTSSEIDQGDLKKTVATSLGSIIGIATEKSTSNVPSVIQSSESVRTCIHEEIFPSLMKSCTEATTTSAGTRYDVLAVAVACENNANIAEKVIKEVMTALLDAIKAESPDDALYISRIASTVLKNGGANTQMAFHKIDVDPIDLVKIIGHEHESDGIGASERVLRVSSTNLSMLNLPTEEQEGNENEMEAEAEMSAADFGSEIITQLLQAYSQPLPEGRLKALFDYFSHLLPPLTDWETVQLSISLPLLSEMLKNSQLSDELKDQLAGMVEPLTTFALECREYPWAVSEAASCLFWAVALHQKQDGLETRIFKEIFSEIQSRLNSVQDPEGRLNEEKADRFRDALNFAALIGSAAACRGSSSTKISNKVAKYIIQLSIAGEAEDLFNDKAKVMLASSSEIQVALQLACATAFGVMISIDAGGPFWKQRLVHLATKEIKVKSVGNSPGSPSFWGCLALQAQIVACGNLSALSENSRSGVSNGLVQGLMAMFPRNSNDELRRLSKTPDFIALQELLLAGIIKLLSESKTRMSKEIGRLVPVTLRLLSGDALTGPKVLGLQVVHIACSFESEKAVLVALKPAVESVLFELLDHPSSVFREMVSETRNHWSIVS